MAEGPECGEPAGDTGCVEGKVGPRISGSRDEMCGFKLVVVGRA